MDKSEYHANEKPTNEGGQESYIRPIPSANIQPLPNTPDFQGRDEIGLSPTEMEQYSRDAKRLLGLDRVYNHFTHETLSQALPTIDLQQAYRNLDTSTNPRKAKIEEKRGIIAEIIQGNLLSKDILKISDSLFRIWN